MRQFCDEPAPRHVRNNCERLSTHFDDVRYSPSKPFLVAFVETQMFATLSHEFDPRVLSGRWPKVHTRSSPQFEECALDPTADHLRSLDQFLTGVERRAFQIARMALRDDDEALDIVQDAMLRLARSYAARPSDEWRPLFYRILNNRIHDWQRRRFVRNKLFGWLPTHDDDETDPLQAVADPAHGPAENLMLGDAMELLQQALAKLPQRQREAFALRNFEGMDVAQTALAMGCTQGSVKTHYSRAVHALRTRLGEAW